MKKRYAIVLGAVLAAVFSCAKEQGTDVVKQKMTFRVNTEETVDASVKAALDGSLNVTFAAGDKISVFDGTSNNAFEAASSGSAVEFTGSAAAAEVYNVLSPYDADATISGNVITATVPKVQTAVLNGVDPKALVAVARTTNKGEIHLKNVVGLLKVQVNTANAVREIQVTPTNYGIAIAGTIDITTPSSSEEVPVYDLNASAEKVTCVTLVPSTGDEFLAVGTYYIGILNKTYEGGLTVGYVQANGTLRGRKGTSDAQVVRSKILSVGALGDGVGAGYSLYSGNGNAIFPTGPDVNLIWKKLAGHSDYTSATFYYDDTVIKQIELKVNTLDGSAGTASQTGASPHPIFAILRDGVLTLYTPASKAQLSGGAGARNMFRGFKGLTAVDFKNILIGNTTTLARLFHDCISLEEVDLTTLDVTNVKSMGWMFYNCTNLKKVDLTGWNTNKVDNSAGDPEYGYRAMFNGCQNLKELKLGAGFVQNDGVNNVNMYTDAGRQTSIDAGGVDEKKCQLYCSQAYYDYVSSSAGQTATAFNPARFVLHVVE